MSVGHSPETHVHAHPELGFLRKYIFSEDHKIIGIQFLFSGIIFFFVGGLLALLVRLQLGWPTGTIPWLGRWFPANWGERMSQDFYTMVFTMHASVMIFFVIIPLLTGAFGNFLIPLMIGAKDMAFPKLNMMSYWFMWPAFLVHAQPASSSMAAPAARAGPPTRPCPAPPCRRDRAFSRQPRRIPATVRFAGWPVCCSSASRR